MFPPTSRYFGVAISRFITTQGRQVCCLGRRFLPPVAGAVAMTEHSVVQGDRLDNVTARYLGDPEQFWRLCDANHTLHPDELTAETGRRILVPLPWGG